MTQRNGSAIRIEGIKLRPVATALAIIYALFGLVNFLIFAVGEAPYMLLPVGISALLFHLTFFNLNLRRSPDLLYNIFLCFAAIAAYALTGWLTGIATALCFNEVARKMGGIDAKYFLVAREQDSQVSAGAANQCGSHDEPAESGVKP